MNPNDDENQLFLNAMKGVKPLNIEKQHHSKKGPPIEKKTLSYRRQGTLIDTSRFIPLPPQPNSPYDPEDKIAYFKSGFSERQKKHFIRGEIPPRASLDLHGLSVDEAHQALDHFLKKAQFHHWRCIKIIHGKGNKEAILKNTVVGLLENRPDLILANHSCIPRQGGTGALLVLLASKS